MDIWKQSLKYGINLYRSIYIGTLMVSGHLYDVIFVSVAVI